MRKLYLLIGALLSLFVAFLIIRYIPKNYTYSYKIGGINVKEQYIKSDKIYYLELEYKDVIYPTYYNKKYSSTRELVSKIDINEEGNTICLDYTIDSKKNTICSDNGLIVDYRLLGKEYLEKYYTYSLNEEESKKVLKYDVYNYNNHHYLLWNYRGFSNISKDNKENINIFTKDIYSNTVSCYNDSYLLFVNYDSEYLFKKIYIYDVKKDLLNDINFDFEISYNSYFAGYDDDNFYLVDRKSETMYMINASKNEISIASEDNQGFYYDNGKKIEVSMKKLSNKDYYFVYHNIYSYITENNTLYQVINDKKIKISNKKISSIVSSNGEKVFYLVGNKLFEYNKEQGETLLMQYSEWDFNYNNSIFIFD